MHFGLLHLPDQVHSLAVLSNPWIIGVALLGAAAEFFADKIMWLDSLWDAAHTIIRPLGGALLATAIVDPSNPAWQVVVFLLGGGGALLSHSAKSGTRALVNVSPEPFSNAALSTVEDGASLGALWLAISHPTVAIVLAAFLALTMSALAVVAWKTVHGVRRKMKAVGTDMATGAKKGAERWTARIETLGRRAISAVSDREH